MRWRRKRQTTAARLKRAIAKERKSGNHSGADRLEAWRQVVLAEQGQIEMQRFQHAESRRIAQIERQQAEADERARRLALHGW